MGKLKLDLDALAVETFETTQPDESQGTVHGNQQQGTFQTLFQVSCGGSCIHCGGVATFQSCFQTCGQTCPQVQTCGLTCQGTCFGTCQVTCQRTCGFTCYATCQLSCGVTCRTCFHSCLVACTLNDCPGTFQG